MMKRLALSLLLFVAGSAIGETSFSGTIQLLRSWTHQKTGATTVTESFSEQPWTWTHSSGTNANEMSAIWASSITITGSGTNLVDLSGVTNSFGDVVSFARVNILMCDVSAANTDPLSIGGASSNAFAALYGGTDDLLSIRPGGLLLLSAPDVSGYSVGTNSVLQIVNTGTNSATLTLTVGGIE